MRLTNKVAIITGAADGIGLAISKAFTKEGAAVIMADINGEKCKQEAKKIVDKGFKAVSIKCSVAKTADMEQLITYTLDHYKTIDILVNNAAVAIPGKITEMPEEDWDTVMNVNLKSVFRGIKLALPTMVEKQSGSIINISSLQALRSWDNWTAYAAAKGAINSMTTQLAGQFGSNNVRINAISPGAIMTPLNEKRIEEEGEGFLKSSMDQSAMLRMGQAEEVAQTAVFLASDEATFITGQNIKIDGGLSVLPRYFEE